MDKLDDVLTARDGDAGDRSFVIKSWLKSYRGSPTARSFGPCYYESWGRVVEEHMRNSRVRIAALTDNPYVIVGFVVYEPPSAISPDTVHYVYVQDEWRRKGVAKWLLTPMKLSECTGYTHTALPGVPLPKGWKFVAPIPAYKRAG